MASAWGSSWGSAFGDAWGTIAETPGTEIPTPAAAPSTDLSNYVICSRTGFRQFADVGLERDGYGELIRKDSADQIHPQDGVRSRGGDRQFGPDSPERNNLFVSDSTAAEDL